MYDAGYLKKLTERELEVLQILAKGRSNKRIAAKLGISVRTVKYHTANIYKKIGVRSRSGAIVWTWKSREFPDLS